MKGLSKIVTRHGAKNGKLGRTIVNCLEKRAIYVEPFGGSFGVGVQSPPHQREVYADLDYTIFCVVSGLAEHGTAVLQHVLKHYTYHDETFTELKRMMQDEAESFKRNGVHLLHGVERGAVALALTEMSINGNCMSFKGQSRRYNFQKVIYQKMTAAQRIRGLECRYQDAFEVIEEFRNSPSAMIVLDPPYLMEQGNRTTRTSGKLYQHDMSTAQEHLRLLETVVDNRAATLICSYRTKLYDDFFAYRPGWYSYDIQRVRKSMVVGHRGHHKPQATETIYTNYIPRPFR